MKKREYDIVLYNSTKKFGNGLREYLGHAYLATSLIQKGFNVKIVDSLIENLSPEEAIKKLQKLRFKCIGINFLSYGYEETKCFTKLFKEKWESKAIIIGGHFVSFNIENIINDDFIFDYAMLGEGENELPILLEKILKKEKGIPQIIKCASITNNLDKLGFPTRAFSSMVINQNLPFSISTSRGCYHACSFCSVNKFYKENASCKWRYRSAEHVVEEIIMLYKKYKTTKFDFIDDNFCGSTKMGYNRAICIAKLLLQYNIQFEISFDMRIEWITEEFIDIWNQVGLKSILLGIESINKDDQKLYNKYISTNLIIEKLDIIKKYDIKVKLGTILWNPYTTYDSVIENLIFFRKIGYVDTQPMVKVNVYKGTEIYEKTKDILYGNFYSLQWNFINKDVEIAYEELLFNIKLSYGVMSKFVGQLDMQDKIYKLNCSFILTYLEKKRDALETTSLIENYRVKLVSILKKA